MKFTKENVIEVYSELLDYDEEMLENDDFVLSVEEMEEQPQLNENQEIVLEWLKDYYRENRPFTTTFGAIRSVASSRYGFIKRNLSEGQQNQVLQVFA